MKFTATSLFDSIAKGASRYIAWRVYVKKTTSLADDLTAGTWVEVTDKIEGTNSVGLRIEFGLGQFTADQLSFIGYGITWWNANVFDATASQYIEIKIECSLGLSETKLASDTVYMYNGFIGKKKQDVVYSELQDTVSFSSYTADEICTTIPAEAISTQYTNGAGTTLILRGIPGLGVTDAAISGYVLKLGTHTIDYDYNGGSQRARLDGGLWVDLSVGSTLGNAEDTADDTERITISADLAVTPTFSVTEEIVVVTEGTTLPKTWYRDVTLQFLAAKLYEKAGISSANVTIGTMEYTTHDSAKALQVLEPPANQGSSSELSTKLRAMAAIGSLLYIARDHQIWTRNMTTGEYTFRIGTTDTTAIISRMIYNARNNHLWVIYGTSGNQNGRVRVLNLSNHTWASSEVVLSTTGNDMRQFSCVLLDYNYTGSSYKYALVYTHSGVTQEIRQVDGGTFADSTVFAAATLGGAVTIISEFAYLGTGGTDGHTYFKLIDGASRSYWDLSIDGAGAWVDNGASLTSVPQYNVGVLAGTRIYYRAAASAVIQSHTTASATTTDHLTIAGGDTCEAMIYDGTLIYFTVNFAAGGDPKLYSISGTDAAVDEADGVYAKDFGMEVYNSRLYILNTVSGTKYLYGYLMQWSDKYTFMIKVAKFGGMSVKEAMTKTWNSFNLVSTMSPVKKALLYRRSDDSGDPVTTGNNMTLTVNEASQIIQSKNAFPVADIVKVATNDETTTYDGTNYDAAVLVDSYVISFESNFIDPDFKKTIAFRAYQFFKTARAIYAITVDTAQYQYEPLDGAAITFTTTKIVKTGTGPIYSASYKREGQIELGVLL